MSEHDFHVHGLHDHELEHAAQGHGNSFTNKIAMFTAIIATVGAIFGYMGGATQAKAFDEMSDAQTHQHHRWAQATTVLQVAIALAAIALLTRKVWVDTPCLARAR